jgi:hypothetical protein
MADEIEKTARENQPFDAWIGFDSVRTARR